MDVTPLIQSGRQIVQSYGQGGFRISGQMFQGAVIITPEDTALWDVPADFSAVNADHFAPLAAMAATLDVLLIGSGAQGAYNPGLQQQLKARGLSAEIMDSGAACRTYNVLMAEGRRLAAALLPVA